MNIDVVKIENKDYYVVYELETKGNKYLYLVSVDDNKDILIRKKIKENDEIFLIGLENEKEFDVAMNLFMEKFNN